MKFQINLWPLIVIDKYCNGITVTFFGLFKIGLISEATPIGVVGSLVLGIWRSELNINLIWRTDDEKTQ